jgi:hypothetical protein
VIGMCLCEESNTTIDYVDYTLFDLDL